jgi:hypothetical protein
MNLSVMSKEMQTNKPSLQRKFQLEALRVAGAAMTDEENLDSDFDASPVAADEYKAECEVLPKGFLNNIDFDSMLPESFETYWLNESRCCIAALPFSRDICAGKKALQASGLWNSFISSRDYIYAFQVFDNDSSTRYINDTPGRYFDMLPEICTKDVSEGGCTFKIDYPDPYGTKSPQNRQWFLDQCNTALANLRKFFGENFGSKPDAKPN